MKKIGLLVGLVLIGSSVAFNFIEKEKDRLINEKIADVKENYKVEVQFKDSSYDYFNDTLVLKDVTMEDYQIKSITVNNSRTSPEYIDLSVSELKLPSEKIYSLITNGQDNKKLKSIINHISKNKEFFTISGSIVDLKDPSGKSVSTKLMIDISEVAKINSKIEANNIPVEILNVDVLKSLLLKMDGETMEKLLKLNISPSYVKVETQGLIISIRDCLIKEETKTNDELIKKLNFGITNIKKSNRMPKILSSNLIKAVESLRDKKEYYVELELDKEISLEKIYMDKNIIESGTKKDIQEMGISLTSKSL